MDGFVGRKLGESFVQIVQLFALWMIGPECARRYAKEKVFKLEVQHCLADVALDESIIAIENGNGVLCNMRILVKKSGEGSVVQHGCDVSIDCEKIVHKIRRGRMKGKTRCRGYPPVGESHCTSSLKRLYFDRAFREIRQVRPEDLETDFCIMSI